VTSDRTPEGARWLFERANRLRASGPPNPTKLLEDAAQEGVQLSWRDITWLTERLGPRSGGWTPAAFVIDFLIDYLQDRGANRLLDPCVTSPVPLLALADGSIAKEGLGFTRDLAFVQAATEAVGNERVSWHESWLDDNDDESSAAGEPELVIGAPPAGMRLKSLRHTLGSAKHLAPMGEAVFIVPTGFLFNGELPAADALARAHLFIHAAVEVPRAFAATGASFALLMLRREPSDQVWVGRLTTEVNRSQLVQNLSTRAEGRSPELGRLVEWTTYGGLDRLAADERVTRLVARTGYPLVEVSDIAEGEIKSPPRGAKATLEPEPNTVFVPTYANARVHAGSDAKGLKASGYYRLQLNPERALAEYVASMLNSELGRALRDSLSGGTTIRHLRVGALRQAAFPLPPLDVQRSVVRTRARIRDARFQLDQLERELGERPREARRVDRELEQLGQSDPLKPWLEALPFPLASIVWRYRIDTEPADKVEHLLRLFEATAEFFVTVLLGAFANDDELLNAELTRWQGDDNRLPLERASFGAWTTLGAAAAGSVRRLLSSGDQDDAARARMRSAFRVDSESFVDLLTQKELWKLLAAQTQERNEDAHGGIKGKREREEQLARLELALTDLRELTVGPLQDVRLVRPGEGAYRKGINEYTRAWLVAGPTAPFPKARLEAFEQLESDELYVVDATDEPVRAGLKLAPLVRLREAPRGEENACYFYNRVAGEDVEFVSHHFERESRITERDAEALAFLRRLHATR
jgi:hypothetical protein